MATEAEDQLAAADAALTAFEEKRTGILNDLKAEAKQIGDNYRAAHEAVEGEQRDAQAAVDDTVIEPPGHDASADISDIGG